MKWFEIIIGVIEIILAIYFTKQQNNLRYMFFMFGGFHLAKGLRGIDDD